MGIGRAIALGLGVAMGHRVVVNYRSHTEEALAVAEEIRRSGAESLAVQADVSDREQVAGMFDRVTERFGEVDILVNNAGIIADNLFMRLREDNFRRVMETNLMGTYYCVKQVLPGMASRRWGRIVNISSVVGERGNAGQVNYASSKSAIHGFTKSLAKEMARRNITVNAVAPGYVETATTSGLSKKIKDDIRKKVPMTRFGSPNEISPVVLMLAAENASYITGQVICVDGGLGV